MTNALAWMIIILPLTGIATYQLTRYILNIMDRMKEND